MNIHRSPKEGITRADIRALIAPFYDRVRANPDIGPVFENRIGVSDSVWTLPDRPERIRYDGSRPNQLVVGRQVARKVEEAEPLLDLVTH